MKRWRRCVTLVLLVVMLLLTSFAGFTNPQPLAAQESSNQAFVAGNGIRNSALHGWIRIQFQGSVAGQYHDELLAPLCTTANVVGCRANEHAPQRLVSLTVERAVSQATPPGDELPALLTKAGYSSSDTSVAGYPARRFVSNSQNVFYAQVLVLEVEEVYYHIALSKSLADTPELMAQIIGAFELLPAEAPAPFIVHTVNNVSTPPPVASPAPSQVAVAGPTNLPTTSVSATSLAPTSIATVTAELSATSAVSSTTGTGATATTNVGATIPDAVPSSSAAGAADATSTAVATSTSAVTPTVATDATSATASVPLGISDASPNATLTAPNEAPTPPITTPADLVTTQHFQSRLPLVMRGLGVGTTAGTEEDQVVRLSNISTFNVETFIRQAKNYAIWKDESGEKPNPDDCYIAMDASQMHVSCRVDNTYTIAADGAHFIDCMLHDAGLSEALCNKAGSYLRMDDLYNFLLDIQAKSVSTPHPGDILFLSDGTFRQGNLHYCWGGIVVEVTGSVVNVATHSRDFDSIDAATLFCGNTTQAALMTRHYLSLDTTAPLVWFTAPRAGSIVPSDLTISYSGSDEGSGIASYSLSLLRTNTSSKLLENTQLTSNLTRLDYPCSALTLQVVATDGINNTSEPATLGLFAQLRGDADGDNTITEADLIAIREADGLTTNDAGFTVALDPTGDGRIDAADRLFVTTRLNNTCPLP